jgi:hypothetical protein
MNDSFARKIVRTKTGCDMKRRPSRILVLLSAVTILGVASCRRTENAQTLPTEVPRPPEIKFTGAAEGWPPRPQGRSEETLVNWTPRAQALTEAQVTEIQQLAVQNAQVHTALGQRFAFITAAEADPDKQQSQSANEPLPVRLTFYSYSNNIAVEVLMRGREVASVERKEGYQPPEGAEEIKVAIEMARRDSRIRAAVKDMSATAIVTYPEPKRPGYGHRILHVSFSGPNEDVPRYYALVDLTDQKILTAGVPAGKEGAIR